MKILILLLFTLNLHAQIFPRLTGGINELTVDNLTSTYTLNESVTDSVEAIANSSRPIRITGVTASSGITLAEVDTSMIADQDRYFSDTTSNNWLHNGSGYISDADNDSTLTYSNIPIELNPNLNFDDWSYVELVTNSSYDSPCGTGWVCEGDWTISGGVASINNSTNASSKMRQLSVLDVNKIYLWKFDWTRTSGTVKTSWYSSSYEYIFENNSDAGGSESIVFETSTPVSGTVHHWNNDIGATGTFDNSSIAELVAPDGWTTSTMDEDNYVIEDNGLRLVSDGTETYINHSTILTAGKTYNYSITISEVSGSVKLYDGADIVNMGAVGTYTGTFTASNNYLRLSRVASCNVVITELSIIHEENNIYLPIELEAGQVYDFGFDYWKVSGDGVINYSLGNESGTTDTIGSSQTASTTFVSNVTGTDTLRISLSEDSIVKIDNVFCDKKANEVLLNPGDTTYISYSLATDFAGHYDGGVTVSYTTNRTVISSIEYDVIGTYDLIVQSYHGFGTVGVPTTTIIELLNDTEFDIDITSFDFTVGEVYSILNEDYIVPANSSVYFDLIFSGSTQGLVKDTLTITHEGNNSPSIITIDGTWTPSGATDQWVLSSPGGGGWHQDYEISPIDNDYIYVITDLSGFWYSSNFGETWAGSTPDSGDYEGADIATHPDSLGVLYMVSASGIWKTWNHGEDWTRLGTGQIYGEQLWQSDLAKGDSSCFSAIYINPNNTDYIIAGTGVSHGVLSTSSQGYPDPARVVRSTDAGVTWVDISGNIPSTGNAFDGFASPSDNVNEIWAASRLGLYYTSNGGTTWLKKASGSVHDVGINPTDNDNIWYASNFWGTTGDIYYSLNDGSNFYDGSAGLPSEVSASSDFDFTSNGDLYVGTKNTGETTTRFYKTSDKDGATWSSVGGPFALGWKGYVNEITSMDITSDGTKIIGGYGEVAMSDDGGTTFTSGSSVAVGDAWRGIGPDVFVINDLAISSDGETVLEAVTDHGLLVSFDGGYSFERQSDIYTTVVDGEKRNNGRICAISRSNNYMYYLGAYSGKNNESFLFRSTDGGYNWSHLSNDLPSGLVIGRMVITSDNTIYLTCHDDKVGSNQGVYRSINNGVNWSFITRIYYSNDLAIDPSDETTIWVVQQYRSYEINDKSILKIENANTASPTISAFYKADSIGNATSVAVHPTNPDIIYVAVNGVSALGATSGNDAFAGVGGIYKTVDGGVNWENVLLPNNVLNKGNYRSIRFNPINSDEIYVGQRKPTWYLDRSVPDGVQKTVNGGSVWTDVHNGLNVRSIEVLKFSPQGELYAGTNSGGAYKLAPTDIAITAPTIASTSVTTDFPNLSATVRVDYNNGNDNNITARSFVGADTLSWFASMDEMVSTDSYAALLYNGLNDGDTLYFKSIVSNAVGSDTSDAKQFVMKSSSGSTVDTLYASENYHNVWRYASSYVRSYDYVHLGSHYANSNGGFIFDGVNDITVDSAKIEFTMYAGFTGTVSLDFYGEDVEAPAIYLYNDPTDFDSRTLTTELDSVRSYTPALSDGEVVSFNVTSAITELMASYNYSNGKINIIIKNNGSVTDEYLNVSTYKYSAGAEKPKLIIYGSN